MISWHLCCAIFSTVKLLKTFFFSVILSFVEFVCRSLIFAFDYVEAMDLYFYVFQFLLFNICYILISHVISIVSSSAYYTQDFELPDLLLISILRDLSHFYSTCNTRLPQCRYLILPNAIQRVVSSGTLVIIKFNQELQY